MANMQHFSEAGEADGPVKPCPAGMAEFYKAQGYRETADPVVNAESTAPARVKGGARARRSAERDNAGAE